MQQKRLPDLMKQPTRPMKRRAQDRKFGFFDEYQRLCNDCSQTPQKVEVYPTFTTKPHGNIDDLIWALYLSMEAFWEAAQHHRANLDKEWPSGSKRKLTESTTDLRAAQRTARRQRSHQHCQILPKLDMTPSLPMQRLVRKNAQNTVRDDRLSSLTEEPNRVYHASMNQGEQAGLSDALTQDWSDRQCMIDHSLAPMPLVLIQAPGSQMLRRQHLVDLGYFSHEINFDPDTRSQMPHGLTSFQGSSAMSARQPIDLSSANLLQVENYDSLFDSAFGWDSSKMPEFQLQRGLDQLYETFAPTPWERHSETSGREDVFESLLQC